MDLQGLKQEGLAKRAGVSQRTVGNMLNAKGPSPKLDSVDKVARAFGLEGWHLISPVLLDDLKSGGSLGRLFDSYLKSSTTGRQHIQRVADREAEYAVADSRKNGTDDTETP